MLQASGGADPRHPCQSIRVALLPSFNAPHRALHTVLLPHITDILLFVKNSTDNASSIAQYHRI